MVKDTDIEIPIRNWNERRFCPDCVETTTFLCGEFDDGYADAVCAFCGCVDEIVNDNPRSGRALATVHAERDED